MFCVGSEMGAGAGGIWRVRCSNPATRGGQYSVLRSGNPISSLTDNRLPLHSLIHADQHEAPPADCVRNVRMSYVDSRSATIWRFAYSVQH